MEITEASIEDAPRILELQRAAYRSEAALYGDYSIPPIVETLDELLAEFRFKLVLKAIDGGNIAGSVRASLADGTCRVDRLIVDPGCQGKGIGTKLLVEIERRFPEAERFELFTGHRSERNIRLYERLGYAIFRRQKINENLGFVFMEKTRIKGGAAGL